MEHEISTILADACRWARSKPDIRALALVGSYAAGTARPDSDVDIMIITDDPSAYRNTDWAQHAVGRRAISGTHGERFGNVWSLFVTLAEGPEIEFTFAERSWVRTDPPAAEVCGIVRGGIAILHDPHGDLCALCGACDARLQHWGQTRRV